jgi:hypothetical protein
MNGKMTNNIYSVRHNDRMRRIIPAALTCRRFTMLRP